MGDAKTSLAMNLSNQANTCKSKKSNLSQYNYFVLLGLEYLGRNDLPENIPVSVRIDRMGELILNGLNRELINDRNICIYSDKKITKSEGDQI